MEEKTSESKSELKTKELFNEFKGILLIKFQNRKRELKIIILLFMHITNSYILQNIVNIQIDSIKEITQ